MLGGIPGNLGEGKRNVTSLPLLNQHIGLGAEAAHNVHIHCFAAGIEGMAAVFFQVVELYIWIGEGCLGHAVAAFKEEGTYIAAIHGGGLQAAARGKHSEAGPDPAIAAIHDHILRNVDGGQGGTARKDILSRLDCTGAKINGFQGFAIGKAVIPQSQRGIPEGNRLQAAATEGIAADAGNAFRHHKGGDAAFVAIPGGGGNGGIVKHIPGAVDGEDIVGGQHPGQFFAAGAGDSSASAADSIHKRVPRGNDLLLLQNLPTDGAFLAIGKAVLGTGGSLAGNGFLGVAFGAGIRIVNCRRRQRIVVSGNGDLVPCLLVAPIVDIRQDTASIKCLTTYICDAGGDGDGTQGTTVQEAVVFNIFHALRDFNGFQAGGLEDTAA